MKENKLTTEELIKHVKLVINPVFKNWILFSHGTYIINEETSDKKEIEEQGLQMMKRFGDFEFGGGEAGDFGVSDLKYLVGWLVSYNAYGMYTYVHPSELENSDPKDYEIGLYGRSKRSADGSNPEIIYISYNGKTSGQ